MRGVEQIPWLYDAICAVSEAFGLARWRRWLVAGARGRVLDLGCGTGRNLALLPPGSVAIGLDPSWASLQRARRRAPGVPLVAASAEALPFHDASFETVLSGLVFCSVPDAPRGLLEARRVLAPRAMHFLTHRSATPLPGPAMAAEPRPGEPSHDDGTSERLTDSDRRALDQLVRQRSGR